MNPVAIQPYIEKKLVSAQPHPQHGDIFIFNYTQKCQFSKAWDEVTTQCRGLIMNIKTGEIIARPFPKFFNIGEYPDLKLPEETPVITKKYDGSLGILYFLPGDRNPRIATRGSFTSDQALWATQWAKKNLHTGLLNRRMTYLFEIIYPENRIVVSYPFSGLVLLAIRHTEANHEFDIHANPHLVPDLSTGGKMRIAETIPHTDLATLKALNPENEEGFVIHYPQSQLRLKMKFEEYVRLHRLVTGVSEKAIWELMKNGQSFDELLERVPDEFYQWVQNVKETLQERYDKILFKVDQDWTALSNKMAPTATRKDWAMEIQQCKYPQLLFARLDRKNEDQIIWGMCRPRVEQKVFKQDIDS